MQVALPLARAVMAAIAIGKEDVALEIAALFASEESLMSAISEIIEDLPRPAQDVSHTRLCFKYVGKAVSQQAIQAASAETAPIATSHGFSDGNKRTAWVIGRLFLAINGETLVFSEIDAINFMLAVAAGNLTEPQVSDWIRHRLKQEENPQQHPRPAKQSDTLQGSPITATSWRRVTSRTVSSTAAWQHGSQGKDQGAGAKTQDCRQDSRRQWIG